jgi:hypothetical protein
MMVSGGKFEKTVNGRQLMIREEMREILAGKGLSVSRSHSLYTSEKLLRCVDGDVVTVGVGGDEKREIQLHAVVDSVHWHLQTKGERGKLRLILGKRVDTKEMDEVLHVSATMIKNLHISLEVQLEIDFLPCELEEVFDDSTYTANEKNWVELINNSQEQRLPELANRLTELVSDRSFKWYRNVTGGCWSGRVDGLQVCTLMGEEGTLDVGKEGRSGDGPARKIFLDVLQEFSSEKSLDFDESGLTLAAEIIRRLAELRRDGELSKLKREHLLESRVLRGKVILQGEDGQLEPLDNVTPFQFPTLWHSRGEARFLDALLRSGDVPWAVELKVPTGSAGQYYRHGITQAVMYREFIRRAEVFYPWFEDKGLDARRCQAALAFPTMVPKQKKLLQYHKDVARAFGVEVIEAGF